MLRNFWWALFAGLALGSCAHPGPSVTVCIVDAPLLGLDCVTEPKTRSFIPFSKMTPDLSCASPLDVENLLKACKAGFILPISLCVWESQEEQFLCTDPLGQKKVLSIPESDHYVCLNEQDRKRVLQRCHH